MPSSSSVFPQRLEPWPSCPKVYEGCAPWWGGGADVFPLGWVDGRVLLVHEAAPACFEQSLRRPLGAESYDWIFLDLFSPGRHEDEWHPGLLEALTARAHPGSVLTSFTCARRGEISGTRTASEGRRAGRGSVRGWG